MIKKFEQPIIDISLDCMLVSTTFHLGDQILIRMPSAAEYETQVEKEQYCLLKLSLLLPLPIPTPLALGNPMIGYYP